MLTGSIPPTGIPMPFISAGGTSLSVFMGAIGILVNVSKYSASDKLFEKNVFEFKFFNKKKNKLKKKRKAV